MRVKLLRHPKFRVGACQFLLVISFAFLHAAAFGEDRTVSDSFAHYSEGEVPVPIFCGGASGGSAFEFTIEFEPLAALNEKIKQNCAKGTANKPVDEFTELAKQKDLESMGGDAFSDYYRFLPPAIALSEVAKGEGQFGDSGAPTLSGSTDGIGPTRTEAFPPCELLNIIFSRPYVSPCLVKAALSIVRPARKVQMRAVASKPFFTKETALCELLQIARRIKSEPSLRVLQYTLRVTGKHVGLQESFAWGNVFAEQEKDPILALLFARDAELEKDFVRRQFYLGSAACYRKDWDDAWRHFQKVHKAAESDAEMAREIVKTYRDTNVQDLELCIWLTRYLKVAKDWDSFELAYEERERIEYESYERYLASEPGHNFAWPIKRLPLKVCFDFEGSDHAELKRIVEDSLGDWTRSTGGKIDFIETVDRKNADLVYK